MASVIPAGFAQVNMLLRHVSATHQGEIVYGIDISGAGAPAAEIADFCTQTYSDTFGITTDAGVQIGPTVLLVGGTPPYLSVEGALSTGGDVTGETVSSNVACLLKKRSLAVAGRGGRGRNFLPWALRDSQVDDVGNVDPTTRANITTMANDWLEAHATGAGGVGPVPVVILHSVGGSTASDIPAPVDSVSIDAIVATQRRRLGR